jgi:hypothetical protein
VYCVSVNDAFVMRQWGLHQGLTEEKADTSNPLNPGNFQKVKLLPDGACMFTRGMGMSCVWDTERGFGERSWRYSVVINDMKVEKIFIEVFLIPYSSPSMCTKLTFLNCRVVALCRTMPLTPTKSLMRRPCSPISPANKRGPLVVVFYLSLNLLKVLKTTINHDATEYSRRNRNALKQ